MTPKELLGASHDATIRENSVEKYLRTLILSPDPELSTPTESRHPTCLLEGKSPSGELHHLIGNACFGEVLTLTTSETIYQGGSFVYKLTVTHYNG